MKIHQTYEAEESEYQASARVFTVAAHCRYRVHVWVLVLLVFPQASGICSVASVTPQILLKSGTEMFWSTRAVLQ